MVHAHANGIDRYAGHPAKIDGLPLREAIFYGANREFNTGSSGGSRPRFGFLAASGRIARVSCSQPGAFHHRFRHQFGPRSQTFAINSWGIVSIVLMRWAEPLALLSARGSLGSSRDGHHRSGHIARH